MSRKTISGPISGIDHLSHRERLKKKVRLTCRRCGHAAPYDVGGIVIHPDAIHERKLDVVLEEYVCFSGYFRCEECHSAWPWEIPRPKLRTLLTVLIKQQLGIRTRGVSFGIPALFDGTICRSPADGEDYLRDRIAEEPGDFYLHNRLGNLYHHHGMFEQARASYGRAVELNPRDAESWFNLGNLHQRFGQDDVAIHCFQQTLRFAAGSQHVPTHDMRAFVRIALEGLFELHADVGNADFLPPFEPPPKAERTYGEGYVTHEFEIHLESDEDWDRLADAYLHESSLLDILGPDISLQFEGSDSLPIGAGRRDVAHDSFACDRRIPRNRPCPCGSGRKFKNCCANAVSR